MPLKPVPYELAEAICLKKAQYCRFADTHNWTGFRGIFLTSIKATFHNPDGSIVVENNVPFSFDSSLLSSSPAHSRRCKQSIMSGRESWSSPMLRRGMRMKWKLFGR
jgi:hypothetical protein